MVAELGRGIRMRWKLIAEVILLFSSFGVIVRSLLLLAWTIHLLQALRILTAGVYFLAVWPSKRSFLHAIFASFTDSQPQRTSYLHTQIVFFAVRYVPIPPNAFRIL